MINCLIVDDEPLARDIIVNYCAYLPDLKVVGVCSSAIEAKEALRNSKADLIFLDINMPVLSGLSLVSAIKNPPLIIFTTAYKEYAAEAFNLAECDYLLKPFSLERFMMAVDRAADKLNRTSTTRTPEKYLDYFFVRTNGELIKVLFDDLLFAEANGNNVKLITVNGKYLQSTTFSDHCSLYQCWIAGTHIVCHSHHSSLVQSIPN